MTSEDEKRREFVDFQRTVFWIKGWLGILVIVGFVIYELTH